MRCEVNSTRQHHVLAASHETTRHPSQFCDVIADMHRQCWCHCYRWASLKGSLRVICDCINSTLGLITCQTTNLGWSWSSSRRGVMQQRLIWSDHVQHETSKEWALVEWSTWDHPNAVASSSIVLNPQIAIREATCMGLVCRSHNWPADNNWLQVADSSCNQDAAPGERRFKHLLCAQSHSRLWWKDGQSDLDFYPIVECSAWMHLRKELSRPIHHHPRLSQLPMEPWKMTRCLPFIRKELLTQMLMSFKA